MLKTGRVRKDHVSLGLAALLLAGYAQSSFAQPAAEKTAEPAAAPAGSPSKTSERVQVTGSRIKRTETEQAAPATAITRDQIEMSGAATLGDLLRNEVANTTGNFAGTVSSVRSGAQTVNLYGLGAGRTLVLLDGERLPKDASLSGTNLSLIPTSMIERVEILTGSRSAVYGSDAVAGVVNIITRKNFVGNEVSTGARVTEDGGGNKQTISVGSGFYVGDSTNVIVSGGYEREERIYSRNRDYPRAVGKWNLTQAGMPDDAFNYRVIPAGAGPGLWQPSPGCEQTSDLRGPGEAARGTFCVGDGLAKSSAEFFPSRESGYVSTRLTSEIGNETTVSSFLSYTQQRSRANLGNYFSSYNYLTGRRQILNAETVNALNLGFTAPEESNVEFYNIDEAAPDRIYTNKDQSYGGFVSVDTKFGSEWNANFAVTHYTSENHRRGENVIDNISYHQLTHGLYENPETLALTRVDAVPQYITVDPNRNTALLADMVGTMKATEKNGLTNLSANLGRDLADLPGGRLAMNVGIDSRIETFSQTPDTLDQEFYRNQPRFTGTESTAGTGDRAVNSAYLEFLAPVVEDVTVEAAVRYDNYSDFGDATNYNLGAKYAVTDSFTLRTSTGSSFRAPELNYVHQVGGGGYVTIRDERWCAFKEASTGTPCIANEGHQIFVDRPGNKELKAEKGKSYSAGFIYEPNNDFFLSSDYAGFTTRDVFNLRSAQDVIDDIYAGRDPGPSTITTAEDGDYVTSMARPWQNIGQVFTYAVQTEGGASTKIGSNRLSYRTTGSRTITYKVSDSDGTMVESVGREGMPKWRWNNTIANQWSDYVVSLSSITLAKQDPDPRNAETYLDTYYNNKVPQYTRYDAGFGWDYTKKGRLVLNVINLENKLGGFYRTGNYTGAATGNSSLYGSSYIGRSYAMNLTQTF